MTKTPPMMATLLAALAFGRVSKATPADDPCAWLTTADVQRHFPGSKAGQLDSPDASSR